MDKIMHRWQTLGTWQYMYVIANGKICTKNVFLHFNLSLSICECYDPRPRFRGLAPGNSKCSLLVQGIKSESFAKYIFEWKMFIYMWLYPVCNICTILKYQRGLIIYDHELFIMDSQTWLPMYDEKVFLCTNPCMNYQFLLSNCGLAHIRHVGRILTSTYTPP